MEPEKSHVMKKKPLAQKLLGRKAEHPLSTMMPLVEEWFATPVGKAMLAEQQKQLDELLSTLFGYHLLQLSICRHQALYRNSKVGHRFSLSPISGSGIAGIADEDALPLETESIDVAVLHHVLEYAQHPLALLKEVSRVVLPSGHVVIVGFNPYSFMGLLSLKDHWRHKGVWQNHILAVTRLADWLTLMDFRIDSVHYGYFRPPFQFGLGETLFTKVANTLEQLQWPMGCFYIVHAQKEVSRLTPIKPRWKHLAKPVIPLMETSLYTSESKKNPTIH